METPNGLHRRFSHNLPEPRMNRCRGRSRIGLKRRWRAKGRVARRSYTQGGGFAVGVVRVRTGFRSRPAAPPIRSCSVLKAANDASSPFGYAASPRASADGARGGSGHYPVHGNAQAVPLQPGMACHLRIVSKERLKGAHDLAPLKIGLSAIESFPAVSPKRTR